MTVYITGDKHGNFIELGRQLPFLNIKQDDTFIILGDSGLNYDAYKPTSQAHFYKTGVRSSLTKDSLKSLFIRQCGVVPTVLLVEGNHEARASLISTYKGKEWNKGTVYYEDTYPEFLFAENGELFEIEGQTYMVIGGAYSVDKYYRLQVGANWFPEEQLSETEKKFILNRAKVISDVDFVLTHTVPYNYIPRDTFLSVIDQSTVDNSMEEFLQEIDDCLNYKLWYAGHYHINRLIKINKKPIKRLRLLHENICRVGD